MSGPKKMICTNSWDEACQKLPAYVDREWVYNNSFVLRVREPMWEESLAGVNSEFPR